MRAPFNNVRQHSGASGAYCSLFPKTSLLADCVCEGKSRKSLIQRRLSLVKVVPPTSRVRRISKHTPAAGPPKNIDKEPDLSNTGELWSCSSILAVPRDRLKIVSPVA